MQKLGSDNSRFYTKAALILSISVLLFLLLKSTLFCDGQENIDDITLFSPIYNYLHTGKLVYPIHGYPESVSVHPPMHYYTIAVLMKWGLSKKLAQSFLLILFTTGIVTWCLVSKRDLRLRLALLLVLSWIFSKPIVNIRPDLTIIMGIIMGYLLLYEAYNQNFKTLLLIVGALLVSYVSVLHYYAWTANGALAITIYQIYRAYTGNIYKKIAQVAVPSISILSLYFIFIFFPDIGNIKRAFSDNQAQLNIMSSIKNHYTIYRNFANDSESIFITALVYPFKILRIPLFIFSIATGVFIKKIRAFIWLTIPFSVFLFLFAQHKTSAYIKIEVIVFVSCVLICGFTVLEFIFKKYWSVLLTAIIILTIFLNRHRLTGGILSPLPQAELARWCGKEINPGSTIISGNNGCWYISGATSYKISQKSQMEEIINHPTAPTNLLFLDSKDISSYNQAVAAEWYIKNKLKLHGFFSASNGIQNPYILYSETLSFSKGFAYFGNQELFTYKPAESDSFYLVTALSPINTLTIEMPKGPCFYQKFAYSMKDMDGNELYKGNLSGKELIWGVLTKSDLKKLDGKPEFEIIDSINVGYEKTLIPENLQHLIHEKPPINILGYY